MKKILFLTGLTLTLASGADAQSFYGPGGLFLHPAAVVQETGKLTPAVLFLPQRSTWTGDDRRSWFTGALTYGLAKNLEVGFAAVGVEGWGRDPSLGGFAKYRLLQETEHRPAVAVGFTRLAGGDFGTQVGFLALRKQAGTLRGQPIVAHFGLQYASEVDAIRHNTLDPFAGLEIGLTSDVKLIAEGRPRTAHYTGTPLALTLAYQVTPSWRLALTWANPGHSDEPHFGFGAGFTLGSR